jgi:hypothetical protein
MLNAKPCLTSAFILAAVASTGAQAAFEIADAKGIKFSTDGWIIVQGHQQRGDDIETTGFRMTSGTTPSLFAFNVAFPETDGLNMSARVGLYINSQSGAGNFRNNGNVGNTGSSALDPREIWGKIAGSWGEILIGKHYSIYQGQPVLADASVLAGGLTGYDNVNTTNALAATFNAGYMYTNFNAGVRYNSPTDKALKVSIGLYDPSQIRNVFVGAGASQTRSPRLEAGVYYDSPTPFGKIKLYADAVTQEAENCTVAGGGACADDKVRTTGGSIGTTVDVGPVNLHLSGFSGKGLGSVLMQDLDAVDAVGKARKSKGYFAQIVYRLGATSLRYSHGRTKIDDTAATQGHTARSNIVGIYHALNEYLTVYGELANSRFSFNPAFNKPTDTDYATIGGRLQW